MKEYKIAHSSDKLKKLIAEHPDYDIVMFAGEDANIGDWTWMACTEVRFDIGEILDADYFDTDDSIISDRDRLRDIVENKLYGEVDEDHLDEAVDLKIAELEPYWRNVIAIYATN